MASSPQVASSTGSNNNSAGQQKPVGRNKIALQPGHSPMDWARLKDSGKDLKGVTEFREYTLEEIAKHNKPDDCWVAIQGFVYNVTAYLDFHPGGRKQLMRAAGKDGTEMFKKMHSWVNAPHILDKCCIGMLAKK
ncbi:hypothetical protein H4219_005074 [Mycoemilia scoparia]|uniref:Cytochrome b5 heme-binding domain-containing protein n=1 Tax=Mycoemilia scoparia TaxID=417184 RepID=A0A9W7ZPE5_9FUNG|nr:hypothetical protein H4219_005074 [Mycoemilia scoparia]